MLPDQFSHGEFPLKINNNGMGSTEEHNQSWHLGYVRARMRSDYR